MRECKRENHTLNQQRQNLQGRLLAIYTTPSQITKNNLYPLPTPRPPLPRFSPQ
jgi:hypothetical protein